MLLCHALQARTLRWFAASAELYPVGKSGMREYIWSFKVGVSVVSAVFWSSWVHGIQGTEHMSVSIHASAVALFAEWITLFPCRFCLLPICPFKIQFIVDPHSLQTLLGTVSWLFYTCNLICFFQTLQALKALLSTSLGLWEVSPLKGTALPPGSSFLLWFNFSWNLLWSFRPRLFCSATHL